MFAFSSFIDKRVVSDFTYLVKHACVEFCGFFSVFLVEGYEADTEISNLSVVVRGTEWCKGGKTGGEIPVEHLVIKSYEKICFVLGFWLADRDSLVTARNSAHHMVY